MVYVLIEYEYYGDYARRSVDAVGLRGVDNVSGGSVCGGEVVFENGGVVYGGVDIFYFYCVWVYCVYYGIEVYGGVRRDNYKRGGRGVCVDVFCIVLLCC